MATITWRGKNNQTARLDWYQNGKRRRVSLGKVTLGQAETLRREKELELRTGASSQLGAPGFKEFAKAYLNWHKHEYPASHSRINQITNDYPVPHLSDTPLDEISPLQLETYKQDRLPRAKTETINKELRTLNAVLNKAIEWQAIYTNPIAKLPTLKNTDSRPLRYYTKEELDQIYAVAPYNWFVWRFLANTGLCAPQRTAKPRLMQHPGQHHPRHQHRSQPNQIRKIATRTTIRRRTIRPQAPRQALRQQEKDRINLHINRPQPVARIHPGTKTIRHPDPPRIPAQPPTLVLQPPRVKHQQSHRTIRPPRTQPPRTKH
jgi:hypothetical protein